MAKHSIERTSDVVRISLTGQFDEEDADLLHSELRSVRFGLTKKVTVDLRGLENCTIMGRTRLMDVQRLLMEHHVRTAWISDKPRFRGTALWVLREVHDDSAGVCRDDESAAAWLEGEEKRTAMKLERYLAWVTEKA